MPRSAVPKSLRSSGNRADKAAERRVRIVAAALAEFTESGFAATRMEDIAKRAQVAKGTLYLHFDDKQALFAEIVRREIVPEMDRLAARAPRPDESMRGYLVSAVLPIAVSLLEPPRRDILQLLLAEGPRFPDLAEWYFRVVVANAIRRVEDLARAARERGEPNAAALERFPQLLAAPMILGVVWSALFERLQPLDVAALLQAQIALLFPEPEIDQA